MVERWGGGGGVEGRGKERRRQEVEGEEGRLTGNRQESELHETSELHSLGFKALYQSILNP